METTLVGTASLPYLHLRMAALIRPGALLSDFCIKVQRRDGRNEIPAGRFPASRRWLVWLQPSLYAAFGRYPSIARHCDARRVCRQDDFGAY